MSISNNAKTRTMRSVTKLLLFVMVLFATMFLMPSRAKAEGYTGSGTKEDPYVVTTIQDLDRVSGYSQGGNVVYIELGADIYYERPISSTQTFSSGIGRGEYVVFDFKGHRIEINGYASSGLDMMLFWVYEGGSLTINDSVGTGGVYTSCKGDSSSNILVYASEVNPSTLIINGGEFVCNKGDKGTPSNIRVQGSSTGGWDTNITINGGHFYAEESDPSQSLWGYNLFASGRMNITINGGIFDNNIVCYNESNLTVNDGDFYLLFAKSDCQPYWSTSCEFFHLNGGKFYRMRQDYIHYDKDGVVVRRNNSTSEFFVLGSGAVANYSINGVEDTDGDFVVEGKIGNNTVSTTIRELPSLFLEDGYQLKIYHGDKDVTSKCTKNANGDYVYEFQIGCTSYGKTSEILPLTLEVTNNYYTYSYQMSLYITTKMNPFVVQPQDVQVEATAKIVSVPLTFNGSYSGENDDGLAAAIIHKKNETGEFSIVDYYDVRQFTNALEFMKKIGMPGSSALVPEMTNVVGLFRSDGSVYDDGWGAIVMPFTEDVSGTYYIQMFYLNGNSYDSEKFTIEAGGRIEGLAICDVRKPEVNSTITTFEGTHSTVRAYASFPSSSEKAFASKKMEWFDITDMNTPLTESQLYAPNHKYRFVITLVANDGYYFQKADANYVYDIEALHRGDEVVSFSEKTVSDNGKKLTLVSDVYSLAGTEIESVEVRFTKKPSLDGGLTQAKDISNRLVYLSGSQKTYTTGNLSIQWVDESGKEITELSGGERVKAVISIETQNGETFNTTVVDGASLFAGDVNVENLDIVSARVDDVWKGDTFVKSILTLESDYMEVAVPNEALSGTITASGAPDQLVCVMIMDADFNGVVQEYFDLKDGSAQYSCDLSAGEYYISASTDSGSHWYESHPITIVPGGTVFDMVLTKWNFIELQLNVPEYDGDATIDEIRNDVDMSYDLAVNAGVGRTDFYFKPGTHSKMTITVPGYAACEVEFDADTDKSITVDMIKNQKLSHTLSVQNNLAINYYVAQSAIPNLTNVALSIEKDVYDAAGEKTVEKTVLPSKLGDYGYGPEHKFVYEGVASYQAVNEIRASLVGEYNGVKYTFAPDVYSIETYCYNQIGKSSVAAKTKKLLVDLLNYCSASQVHFGIKADTLANRNLTSEQKALGTTTAPSLQNVSGTKTLSGATTKFNGKTLVLGNNVELKIYMILDSSVKKENVRLRITYQNVNSENVVAYVPYSEFTYDSSRNEYAAKYTGLIAPEFRKVMQLTVMEGDKEISDTDTYSIETYAYNRVNGSSKQTLKDVVTEMMKYSDSALAYFK